MDYKQVTWVERDDANPARRISALGGRDFRHSAWAAYTQVMFDPVPEIRQQAWNNHTYVVRLAPEALAFGLASGLVITLFLEGLLRLLLRPFRRRRTNLGRI